MSDDYDKREGWEEGALQTIKFKVVNCKNGTFVIFHKYDLRLHSEIGRGFQKGCGEGFRLIRMVILLYFMC